MRAKIRPSVQISKQSKGPEAKNQNPNEYKRVQKTKTKRGKRHSRADTRAQSATVLGGRDKEEHIAMNTQRRGGLKIQEN